MHKNDVDARPQKVEWEIEIGTSDYQETKRKVCRVQGWIVEDTIDNINDRS